MAEVMHEKDTIQIRYSSENSSPPVNAGENELVNASGHVQEVDRKYVQYLRSSARILNTNARSPHSFSLLTLAGVGIVLGSTWGPAGSSIIVALYNGGPPGVLYEFIVVSIFYWIVAASIAELASAIPSAGGVYHWASVTPGKKYGRVVGFFAGYWNMLAWVLGAASISAIAGRERISCIKHTS